MLDHVVEGVDAGEVAQSGRCYDLVGGLAGWRSSRLGKLDAAVGADNNVLEAVTAGGRGRGSSRARSAGVGSGAGIVVWRAQKEKQIGVRRTGMGRGIVVGVVVHLLADGVVGSAGHVGAGQIGGLKQNGVALESVAVDVRDIVPHHPNARNVGVLELGDILAHIDFSVAQVRGSELQRDASSVGLAAVVLLVADGRVWECNHRSLTVADRPDVGGEVTHVDDGGGTLSVGCGKSKRRKSDSSVGVLHFFFFAARLYFSIFIDVLVVC